MSGPRNATGRASNLATSTSRAPRANVSSRPSDALEADSRLRTPMGLGVPVAPSFLNLEEEDVALRPTNEARGSFHTVPVFPDGDDLASGEEPSVESNLHQIQANAITNSLAPEEPRSEVRHLRIGVSSHPPERFSSEPVRPQPSRRRSFFARFLFLAIVIAVCLLAATELSMAAHLPWLDPRPHLARAVRFVVTKVPWGRIRSALAR